MVRSMGHVRKLLTAALLFVAAVASAQSVDVTFVNRTGATIFFLYASRTDADSWGNDLLGSTVLPDGGIFRARIRGRGPLDVLAVDANDNEFIVWEWDPGPERRIVITTNDYAGSRPRGSDVGAISWISIVNDTNYDIEAIIVAPSGAEDWEEGQRFLRRGEFLFDGEDFIAEVDVERFDTVVYDVLLIDVDGDSYIKWDINFELQTEVIFTLDDLVW